MSRVREFPLPDLGEGLTEGEILTWLVAEGDTITLNQPIVEVETAKAAVEIPAKWAGRVVRIFHPAGTTVEVGTPIIAIDTSPAEGGVPVTAAVVAEGRVLADGSAEPASPGPGGRTPVLVGYGPRLTGVTRRPRKATGPQTTRAPARATTAGAPPVPGQVVPRNVASSAPAMTVLAKPPVRKLARDLGVNLAGLVGSGPAGSITRDDVQAAVAEVAAAASVSSVSSVSEVGTTAVSSMPLTGPQRERRIPVKGVRKLTAENMVASAFTAPHVTEFLTIDMTRAMRALKRLRELPDWRDARLSPLLLVAKAVLLAVRRHPMVNSTWAAGETPSAEPAEIVVKEYVNLGVAAATPRGLVVPNIKDAGRLTLRELADALTTLVTTAKSGRTAPADMTGGTFTITNIGVFGVDSGTPILPPGEAAILAFGAVREMPWVHRGRVRVRQVATLGLSFDHRVVDGELGSMFLADVGAFLSDPTTTLLAWT